MLTADLLLQALSLSQNNSFSQNRKKLLHQFTFLKTDSLAQHCQKDHRNSHCWTDLKNDWKTQHAVCSSDECASRTVNKDNSESVSQSDSWNLMRQRSCDFTAIFRHHRSLWSDDTWQNDACSADQENFKAACEINKNIHDKQNLNFNAIKHQNRKKINIYWSITRIFFIFHSLFVLCSRIFEDMQQHQWLTKYKHFCEWHHTADLWANHWKELQNSWECI